MAKKDREVIPYEIYDTIMMSQMEFMLAERQPSFREAQVAAAEYRADAHPQTGMAYHARVRRIESARYYEIWVGPQTRKALGHLSFETIKRANDILRVKARKLQMPKKKRRKKGAA